MAPSQTERPLLPTALTGALICAIGIDRQAIFRARAASTYL